MRSNQRVKTDKHFNRRKASIAPLIGSACTTTCLAGWAMSTGAVVRQSLRDDPQEDAQHHIAHRLVTLHVVAQLLWDGVHPVAHRQAGENMVRPKPWTKMPLSRYLRTAWRT